MINSARDKKTDHSNRYFLSCDWGTSSFRLHVVNRQTGKIEAAITNDNGSKKICDQWLSVKKSQDRIEYYRSFLTQQIDDLKKRQSQNIDQVPLVISGMASSSIGMYELPYGDLPFTLDHPEIPVKTFGATDQFPHDIHLISGLQSSKDVMRGEETELLGLYSKYGMSNALYLLAGTHSKHVTVKNKNVIDFKTFMTGELFGLLSSKSILSNSVTHQSQNGPGPAFEKGLANSLNENMLHELFTIRARDILHQSDPIENYNYLSGLLIGTELQVIRQKHDGKIVLAGCYKLQKYYAAALNILDLNFTQSDSSAGQNITSLGHLTILNQLQR